MKSGHQTSKMKMGSSKLKEESGVIKIKGLKLGYQIQGWKWGHQTSRMTVGSSKFKVENRVIKNKGWKWDDENLSWKWVIKIQGCKWVINV